MTQLVQSLLERLSQLPESLQNQLAERFLRELEETEEAPEKHRPQRVAGLGQGTLVISDDFDDPLPDSFWLGKA
jgi:Protein of unknown function (DUF2281)